MRQNKKKLNSAVVGMGIGNLHAKTLKNNKKVKLVYICDKKKNLS